MTKAQMIDQIHAKLAAGQKVIHPEHRAYEFVREPIIGDDSQRVKYQRAHFATRDDHTLALRCSSNWFGSLIAESDLPATLEE